MSRSRLSLLDQCWDGFMEVHNYKSQKNLRTNKHNKQHIALFSKYWMKAIKQMTLCLVPMSRSRLSLLARPVDSWNFNITKVKRISEQTNTTQHIALFSNYWMKAITQ